ncbi:chloride channel protein [Thalassotalea euphylliae]|nr:chloride channel protein [Thalassotalea euphylliae]
MLNITRFKNTVNYLDIAMRKRLALPITSWQLCLLAIIGGTISSLLIALFIGAINSIQQWLLADIGHYTSLTELNRLFLPIIGALAILLTAWLTGYQYIRTGIPFVLHRLKVAYGVIPLRNTINQFFGGIIALASGFSVGKEGPAVHLGAASSAYLGSRFNLPSNATRTLAASGVAAGIAACFNTPIAAVIFVMEVILREYKIHMFIPIMLAAIVGSMVTSTIFGPAHGYEFFSPVALDFEHYPWLILLGLMLGTLAAIFNRFIVAAIENAKHFHVVARLLIAGLITGSVGFIIPYAMGTDLGAMHFTMSDDASTALLLGLLVAKCGLTIVAVGMGIPGGVIGPIFSIGAIAGAVAAGMMGIAFEDKMTSDFALMGMAGFMAATLNAPLAALLAVVELSNQLEIIAPSMLVISTACLCAGQLFNNRSVFIMQLNVQELSYRTPPLENTLHNIGVLGIMRTNLALLNARDTEQEMQEKAMKSEYLIMQSNGEFYWNEVVYEPGKERRFRQHKLIPISSCATLAEAYLQLNEQRLGGVYIYDKSPDNIIGLLTFEQIRAYLTKGKI